MLEKFLTFLRNVKMKKKNCNRAYFNNENEIKTTLVNLFIRTFILIEIK